MGIDDFFAFAAEMNEALKPIIREITANGSEEHTEAYKHAITAFKSVAAATLKNCRFVLDTADPDKLTFYIFEDARSMMNFMRSNNVNVDDRGFPSLPKPDDELKQVYFDDFVKSSHDWISPVHYKMVGGLAVVAFDRR